MAVLRDLGLLISLQRVDVELSEGKQKSGEIRLQIEELGKERERMENDCKGKQEELKLTRIKKREKEKKIDEIDLVLAKHENEKYKIKTQHEFETLEKEINLLEDEKRKTEDILLELMEKEEELDQLLPDLRKKLEKTRIELDRRKQGLESELSNVCRLVEQLGKKREELAGQLDSYHLRLYEQLRKSKEKLAVVPLKGDICQGCFVKVSPSLTGQVRHQREITYCESCNRILYPVE